MYFCLSCGAAVMLHCIKQLKHYDKTIIFAFQPLVNALVWCCHCGMFNIEVNKPTLWGSSVKLGRSRLPASAWLSWSTSYMLYDGFPISTFIPPFVMGCLWTRFPLRCAEPGIINMIHNMQVNLYSVTWLHKTNHITLLGTIGVHNFAGQT